jgi:hypothetical protein
MTTPRHQGTVIRDNTAGEGSGALFFLMHNNDNY